MAGTWWRSRRIWRRRRSSPSSDCPTRHLGGRAAGAQRCTNSGLDIPRRRLTVNLSPASLPKHGSGFDLGIAVATAPRPGRCARAVRGTVHIGELGLDGRCDRWPVCSCGLRPRGGFTGDRAARQRRQGRWCRVGCTQRFAGGGRRARC
ncbi:magnesium chelatase domain-containing protein [Microbacterium sp.]|uniref:magnesium chelatase domain-containing protein n=1 Tax=Microbacterium sp. TaxID=51671 RepID=UPI003A8CDFC6